MAVTSKHDAVRTLEEGRREVETRLARLSDEELWRAGALGGWSAGDLIGHLAFWEEIALQSLEAWRAGERPWIEDVFGHEDIDRVNAEDVERKRAMRAEEVRAAAEETHAKLVSQIEEMNDIEWRSAAPYRTERRKRLAELLGSVLGAPKRPFGHASAHLPDLDGYLASLGR